MSWSSSRVRTGSRPMCQTCQGASQQQRLVPRRWRSFGKPLGFMSRVFRKLANRCRRQRQRRNASWCTSPRSFIGPAGRFPEPAMQSNASRDAEVSNQCNSTPRVVRPSTAASNTTAIAAGTAAPHGSKYETPASLPAFRVERTIETMRWYRSWGCAPAQEALAWPPRLSDRCRERCSASRRGWDPELNTP